MAKKKNPTKKKDQLPKLNFDGVWFENGRVLARIPSTKEKPEHDVVLLDTLDGLEEGESLLEELLSAIQQWIDDARESED
jgi:hypothetical protein